MFHVSGLNGLVCKSPAFLSARIIRYIDNIKVLKQLLGDDVCTDLLFAHAFTGCDTTSRIFGVGEKISVPKTHQR